ncbi:MAG: DUF6339 family protein [Lachnospiraceae bacterium]
MILPFIDEEKLLSLKSNLHTLVEEFQNPDNLWLERFLGSKPFTDSKFTAENFVLDMSQEKPFLTEYENVRRVYSHLKFLSDSEASDERLWAGMCLGPFWSYTQYRWNVSTADSIQQHYMFGYGSRRSLTRNALSRLWWIGRLTYDNFGKRAHPYELTQFVCENSDYIMHVLERNTSNNPTIVSAFLAAVLDARNDGFSINTNLVGELAKYLNLLGGIYILDCLDYQYIYDKIKSKVIATAKTN